MNVNLVNLSWNLSNFWGLWASIIQSLNKVTKLKSNVDICAERFGWFCWRVEWNEVQCKCWLWLSWFVCVCGWKSGWSGIVMREHGVREEEGIHNWAMHLCCLLLLESAVKLVSWQWQRNICWHCGDCCWKCWTKGRVQGSFACCLSLWAE